MRSWAQTQAWERSRASGVCAAGRNVVGAAESQTRADGSWWTGCMRPGRCRGPAASGPKDGPEPYVEFATTAHAFEGFKDLQLLGVDLLAQSLACGQEGGLFRAELFSADIVALNAVHDLLSLVLLHLGDSADGLFSVLALHPRESSSLFVLLLRSLLSFADLLPSPSARYLLGGLSHFVQNHLLAFQLRPCHLLAHALPVLFPLNFALTTQPGLLLLLAVPKAFALLCLLLLREIRLLSLLLLPEVLFLPMRGRLPGPSRALGTFPELAAEPPGSVFLAPGQTSRVALRPAPRVRCSAIDVMDSFAFRCSSSSSWFLSLVCCSLASVASLACSAN